MTKFKFKVTFFLMIISFWIAQIAAIVFNSPYVSLAAIVTFIVATAWIIFGSEAEDIVNKEGKDAEGFEKW